MLFSSYAFLVLFFPAVLAVFYTIGHFSEKNTITKQQIWLICSSLAFYTLWEPKLLLLLGFSILTNFFLGQYLQKKERFKKLILIFGMIINITVLAYFKYANFFLENIAFLQGNTYASLKIILPLGISFWTFQQMAYLADLYQNKLEKHTIIEYTSFVSFFPQLIAGPIVTFQQFLPQIRTLPSHFPYKKAEIGLYLLVLGLIKKVLIADSLAIWANTTFALQTQPFWEVWRGVLAYAGQIYFDFSGYSDMALGLGLFFGITLPFNFNQPYFATGIADFWRKWHITLTKFLTQYVYFPLGGSRTGKTYLNIMIVFFISGIWHGAGWTFIVWGLLHGLFSVTERIITKQNITIPKNTHRVLTFFLVVHLWVLFRAETMPQTLQIWQNMYTFNQIDAFSWLFLSSLPVLLLIGIAGFFFKDLLKEILKDAPQILPQFTLSKEKITIITLGTIGLALMLGQSSEFLYFQF